LRLQPGKQLFDVVRRRLQALVTNRAAVSAAAMMMGILVAVRQTLLLADRRRLITATEVARSDAEVASKAKSEFLSHMSHEIGTPLASVIGYDDSPVARLAHIDLTTVSQNTPELTEHAVAAVMERLDNGRADHREVVVAPHLVVRGTTGPPRI